jgi:hypothetical protein
MKISVSYASVGIRNAADAYNIAMTGRVAGNTHMIKAEQEFLRRYQSVTIGGAIVARKPVFRPRLFEIQNTIQAPETRSLIKKAAP